MNNDNVKIFILNNYIRRLWGWLTTLGSVFAIAGVVVFYERMGILKPVRSSFSYWELHTWSITAFSATAGCVTVAVIVGIFLKRAASSAKTAASNPSPPSNNAERETTLASEVLGRIRVYESVTLFFSACPALLGTFLFVIGRPENILLIYLAISLVMCIIFLPSLEHAEKTVNAYIKRHDPTSAPGE